MPKHHPAPARQGLHRLPQRVAEPLVGHQPARRDRLARAHGGAYSRAVSPEATTAAARLAVVQDRIARAARLAGRNPDDTALIAISKTQPTDAIVPLIAAGQRAFGENRVQEAQGKWPALRAAHFGLELHLVGQLQSNKAADAVALFDVIHSLDRPSLVTALGRAMERGRRPDLLVQVNIGDEPQKGGCAIADLPVLLAEARTAELPVRGLMCVPPDSLESAPYFALLARLARDHGLPWLSMGMSGDVEAGVMLGATHVRVGTALFGDRA